MTPSQRDRALRLAADYASAAAEAAILGNDAEDDKLLGALLRRAQRKEETRRLRLFRYLHRLTKKSS